MGRETINFRTEPGKIRSLDTIAAALDRDRTYVINEAISAYLDLYRWGMDHIKEGIRQADAGEFATEDEVEAALKRHKRPSR